MTIIILTSLLIVLLSYFLHKSIRKYNIYIFVVIGIIAILVREDANIISLGYVPFGIFLVVMFTGVLNKSTIQKRLLSVRAELSIIASILILPHGLAYLDYYLDDIGFLNGGISFYIGIISILVMIPLMITSFKIVRRKLRYSDWKKLHMLAYLFYLLVGLHLILIGNDRQIAYIVLLTTYSFLKLWIIVPKYVENKKHPKG